MHGSGIIDHGRDILLFETGLERIAFFLTVQADSVLRPARIVAFGNDRGLYLAAQLAGVEGGGFVDVPQLVFAKSFEFYFQDSGDRDRRSRVKSAFTALGQRRAGYDDHYCGAYCRAYDDSDRDKQPV